jgi:ABC-type transporter Mla subunit MlaD
MARLIILLVVILALAVLGGCLFLAYWNFPVPSTPVEKVLPDARFPR